MMSVSGVRVLSISRDDAPKALTRITIMASSVQQSDRLTIVIDAKAPFNDPKADVILRTSDNVDFLVFKLLLSLASPFFERKFAQLEIPQANPPSQTKSELLVIDVSATSATIEALLRLCYPKWGPDPVLATLDELRTVLEASVTYEMKAVTQSIGSILVGPHFAQEDPIRLFAIACRFELVEAAKIAARNTLRVPISERSYVPELEYITAGTLQRLQEYYFKCSEAASAVASDPDAGFPWNFPHALVSFKEGKCCGVVQRGNEGKFLRLWWNDYLRDASMALKSHPHGETLFDPILMKPIMARILSCDVCRGEPSKSFFDFTKKFAVEVERRISEVRLLICLPLVKSDRLRRLSSSLWTVNSGVI
jgi:hypothetical protein